jgi:hypothetical protein
MPGLQEALQAHRRADFEAHARTRRERFGLDVSRLRSRGRDTSGIAFQYMNDDKVEFTATWRMHELVCTPLQRSASGPMI